MVVSSEARISPLLGSTARWSLRQVRWPRSPCFSTSVSGASAPSRSVLDGSRWFGGPGPGQQFAEAAVWPVIDELGEHVSQVGMRIDAMQFAGLDQRGEHGPVFCPFIRTGEESVFSVESNWA